MKSLERKEKFVGIWEREKEIETEIMGGWGLNRWFERQIKIERSRVGFGGRGRERERESNGGFS